MRLSIELPHRNVLYLFNASLQVSSVQFLNQTLAYI